MSRAIHFIASAVAALGMAACGDSADSPAQSAMPGVQQAAPDDAPRHTAEGTLNSIDPAAGTVNISHGPVASAQWPAMTMTFKVADPNAATKLTPGQRVEFQFTIESGMSATVTQISPVE